MSIITILETLLIGPLKLVFEIIFSLANRLIGQPGLAIIVLSLTMNILVLPLYRQADAIQEEAKNTDDKLRDGVEHIKKTFSGDERMMILQAYYRQNHYSPLSALKGSVSLLLEIPFFMAAYQFLSNLTILNGVSLGPITDLGAPDGLLTIGSITLNLLPILMTLVNIISSYLYLKGFPLKAKIQLYAMALFFLFFLYDSPSCLVFYWTLNNVFSLVKTIFYKLKNPKKVLTVLTAAAGVGLLAFALLIYDTPSTMRKAFLSLLGLSLLVPAVLPLVRKILPKKDQIPQPNRKLFFLGGLFLTVLTGLLIPSTFLAASPQEYVDISYFYHPLWYLVSSACLAAGTFLVWMGVFYWLASPGGKVIFDRLVWVLCGVMIVNYMFFGTDMGVISSSLLYENGMVISGVQKLTNMLVILALGGGLLFVVVKKPKLVAMVLLTASIALGGMSVLNITTVNASINTLLAQNTGSDDPHFRLSKTGNNVVVLVLDRAMGEYVPYLFAENPELEKMFSGFTYYSNTISFGGYTNTGSSAMFGGYEYTPVEMNKRDQELLKDKHNEALKLLPVTFLNKGYEVTVCDPLYANYQWIPDLSIFDEYPDINSYITEGTFMDAEMKEAQIQNNMRNFFCFSVMKSMPLVLQPTIYANGTYNQAAIFSGKFTTPQNVLALDKATGANSSFLASYNTLTMLSNMTQITDEQVNTFLSMTNSTTHNPQILQMPTYTPAQNVDNSAYFGIHANGITVNGVTLRMETADQVAHYHANMAALIQIGQWLNYLRENDVYDNTRIIIVADHGKDLGQIDYLADMYGSELYFPLMMVKDFNSEGFTTSTEFMTNADVPFLAVSGLLENPTNPFTGKPITNSEKTAHDQFIIMTKEWDVNQNNGYTYKESLWASVKDDIWDSRNWTFYEESTILKDHAAP